jgi:ribose-phosphate pyrophosphokinase
MPRVPISSSVVANMLTIAGASRILTIDIHSEQQQGFTHIPWDNLYGSYSLIPTLKKLKLRNLVVASPDKGGMLRATGYARLLGAQEVALVYKERDVSVNNKSEASAMIGDVKGKDVLLVDDMLDTGGTIVHAANFLKEKGATSVRVAITHGLFSADAIKRITSSAINEVIITDTIEQREESLQNKKIKVVSIAPLLAEAIRRITSGESISSLVL